MLFCTVVSLKVNSMNVFDVKKKVLDAEIFPQHTIVDLNSGSTFLVLFSQEKPLMLKGSKHTHTDTHTHTHTHTSTCGSLLLVKKLWCNKIYVQEAAKVLNIFLHPPRIIWHKVCISSC